MARIRTIKPDFCQSETLGSISRDARLCFAQLWTFVDDEGRCRAATRILAGALFPFDEDAPSLMDVWLAELETIDCVCRYQVGGTTYLQVRNWKKHQKIDRPSPSRLPPPPGFDEPSMNSIEDSTQPRLPLDAGPRTLDLGPSTPDPSHADASAGGGEVSIVDRFFEAYPADRVAEDGVKREIARRISEGVDPDDIVAGARRYAQLVVGRPPDKISNPVNWLRDGRWKDGPIKPTAIVVNTHTSIHKIDPRWKALSERWRREKGKPPPDTNTSSWAFPNDWIDDLKADRRVSA